MNGRGFAEDETYLKNLGTFFSSILDCFIYISYLFTFSYLDILKNIRRGNTFIKYNDEEGNEKVVVGRKGMIKFYDIFREMLEDGAENSKLKEAPNNKKIDDAKQAFSTMNIIMAGVYRSLEEGYKVEAVRTLKANGENAQISWNSELGLWIFSSKNVALLAKTPKDIETYKNLESNTRYNFAILIAEAWFEKVKEIKENGIDINEFKKDLDGKTLIGEYVGDPNHKHLIIYPKIRIVFYTIVDNNSVDSCLLPEDSYNFFKKYSLEWVTYESLGLFEKYADLIDTLRITYSKISSESIATGEEGSVIYFVRRTSDPETQQPDKVLSLGKMKTLEYRFYRKLREKLAGAIARIDKTGGKDKREIFEGMLSKYKKEIKELTRCPFSDHSLMDDDILQYYQEIAQKATEVILDDASSLSNVRDGYLDFLERLIEGNKLLFLISLFFVIKI